MIQEFLYPSKSSDETHRVLLYEDGTLSCSCRGYSTPNKCWHLRDAAKKQGKELEIGTYGARLK